MISRVAITGLGVATSLGVGCQENWAALTHGPSSVSPSLPSLSGFLRAQDLAEQAAEEALASSGLSRTDTDPEKIGSTFSASKPLFHQDIPKAPETLSRTLAKKYGWCGEHRNVIAACATGAYAIAMGASWIEQGLCEVVVTGSVEPYPHPLFQAGFRQMGVTSSDGMTRPFDKNRSGFAFGEGAGVVILEAENHARRRNARVRAILSGWALGADSHSAFAFNSGGGKISGVIDKALRKANLRHRDVHHVNAHGTGTRHNDWIETQALLKSFGSHARELMISATKASTGHLLGASGAVELIYTALALENQFIPPTATLEDADPDCPLDYTPQVGHAAVFTHALSLSFGFGGPIGALLVSRP